MAAKRYTARSHAAVRTDNPREAVNVAPWSTKATVGMIMAVLGLLVLPIIFCPVGILGLRVLPIIFCLVGVALGIWAEKDGDPHGTTVAITVAICLAVEVVFGVFVFIALGAMGF